MFNRNYLEDCINRARILLLANGSYLPGQCHGANGLPVSEASTDKKIDLASLSGPVYKVVITETGLRIFRSQQSFLNISPRCESL
eukprot:1194327-Prorocentrum_minimum.AAC.1